MKKVRMMSLACAALAGCLAFGSIAASNAQNTSAYLGQVASAMEQKNIQAFLAKTPWSKELNVATDLIKSSYESHFESSERSIIQTRSKDAGLRGTTDDSTTIYTCKKDYKLDNGGGYSLIFAFFTSVKNGMVEAAVIKRVPSADTKGTQLYSLKNTTPSTIEKDAAAYAKMALFVPPNSIGRKSTIYGYKVDGTSNSALKQIFQAKGWDSAKWTFYQNIADGYHPPYLSSKEVGEAMKASANGGPQVMMMMPESGFYFYERSYVVKGTNHRFFVDFVASGVNTSASKPSATFSFLIVKPGRVNSKGELDKFFYPADTDIKIILSDMKAYLNSGKQPR